MADDAADEDLARESTLQVPTPADARRLGSPDEDLTRESSEQVATPTDAPHADAAGGSGEQVSTPADARGRGSPSSSTLAAPGGAGPRPALGRTLGLCVAFLAPWPFNCT